MRKRNQQLKEIDTQWTATTPPGFPILRAAVNTYVTRYLQEQWVKDWREDKRVWRTRVIPDYASAYKKSVTHTQRIEEVDKRISGADANTENWAA